MTYGVVSSGPDVRHVAFTISPPSKPPTAHGTMGNYGMSLWVNLEREGDYTVWGRAAKGCELLTFRRLRISRLSGSPLWFQKLIRLGPS